MNSTLGSVVPLAMFCSKKLCLWYWSIIVLQIFVAYLSIHCAYTFFESVITNLRISLNKDHLAHPHPAFVHVRVPWAWFAISLPTGQNLKKWLQKNENCTEYCVCGLEESNRTPGRPSSSSSSLEHKNSSTWSIDQTLMPRSLLPLTTTLSITCTLSTWNFDLDYEKLRIVGMIFITWKHLKLS